MLTLVAWLTPVRFWRLYAGGRARLYRTFHPRKIRDLAERTSLADTDTAVVASGPAIIHTYCASSFEKKLQTLRLHRPGSWCPPLSVEGTRHIDAGLSKGRGVVLWTADFAFHSLILKMALHGRGYDVSHLSGPRHGWSATRLGVCILNPLQIRAESRFLRERVVMSDLALPTAHRVVAAMRVLRRRLGENGVVSIGALTSNWGPEKVQFFRGRVRLARGPLSLAYACGAPALPVFAVRETDGEYRIVVEPPLGLDSDAPRRVSVRAAMEQYVALLERYVSRYPGQWLGWRFLEPFEATPTPSARPR